MPIKEQKSVIFARRLFSGIYIDRFFKFFNEVGLNNDRDALIKSLKKLKGTYVANLLIAISFAQYCEKVIEEKDDLLKPVLLICLINAIEEKTKLKDNLVDFFKRLDDKDKLYLLNNFLILKGRGEKRQFKRVYDDLIRKHKIYRSIPLYESVDYQVVDKSLRKINCYMEIIADHFYHVRNCTLHEFKSATSVTTFDETWKQMISVHSFYVPFQPQKKNRRIRCFVSDIDSVEFRRIIKRGILKKINVITNK